MKYFGPRCLQEWVMVGLILGSLGCTHTVTVHYSKSGADRAEFQRDKDECQSLQRAAGVNQDRIANCLKAKGWLQVSSKPVSVKGGPP